MAATIITAQPIVLTGLSPVLGAATAPAAGAGGDKFLNNGRKFAHILNGSAAEITATVTAVGFCSRGSLHSVSVAIPAGEFRQIGPFPQVQFNDSSGYVTVFVSLETTVTLACIELPS